MVVLKQESGIKEALDVELLDDLVYLLYMMKIDIGKDHIKLLVPKVLKLLSEVIYIEYIFNHNYPRV